MSANPVKILDAAQQAKLISNEKIEQPKKMGGSATAAPVTATATATATAAAAATPAQGQVSIEVSNPIVGTVVAHFSPEGFRVLVEKYRKSQKPLHFSNGPYQLVVPFEQFDIKLKALPPNSSVLELNSTAVRPSPKIVEKIVHLFCMELEDVVAMKLGNDLLLGTKTWKKTRGSKIWTLTNTQPPTLEFNQYTLITRNVYKEEQLRKIVKDMDLEKFLSVKASPAGSGYILSFRNLVELPKKLEDRILFIQKRADEALRKAFLESEYATKEEREAHNDRVNASAAGISSATAPSTSAQAFASAIAAVTQASVKAANTTGTSTAVPPITPMAKAAAINASAINKDANLVPDATSSITVLPPAV
jgi:hypothetical protein